MDDNLLNNIPEIQKKYLEIELLIDFCYLNFFFFKLWRDKYTARIKDGYSW